MIIFLRDIEENKGCFLLKHGVHDKYRSYIVFHQHYVVIRCMNKRLWRDSHQSSQFQHITQVVVDILCKSK